MFTTLILIIISILLFGLIILVHEFGHFFSAKSFGVKINEFALGMGPTLFKIKKGNTIYSLRALPIGGFCAMEGENETSEDIGSFSNKPVWQRIIIVVAGAFMNIVLGFIFMIILLSQNPYFASNVISKFADDSITKSAGLEVGDKILSINNYRILTDNDLGFAISTNKDGIVDFKVLRDGQKIDIKNVNLPKITDENGNSINSLDFYVEPIPKNIITLISQSFKTIISMVKIVWNSFLGLITGRFGFNDMSGPVGAASAISQAASMGLKENFVQATNNIIMMMVIITVNLGIFNLLPIPALDGGKLVFLVIEGIRRKPINPKYEGYVHAAGFAILILFMLIVTFSDILRVSTGKGLGG